MNIREKYSLECGEGWDEIIKPLIEYVERHNENAQNDEDKIEIVQIKEKFGGLRFYTRGKKLDELEDLIQAAENEAYHTCELCGSKKDIGQTADGWITTCCRDCVQGMANNQKRKRRWYSQQYKIVLDILPTDTKDG